MQGDVLISAHAPATSIYRQDACLCAIVLEGNLTICRSHTPGSCVRKSRPAPAFPYGLEAGLPSQPYPLWFVC